METIKIIKSSDGVEYQLTVFEDIIKLNRGQIELIEEEIQRHSSSEVENNSGIHIRAVTDDQSAEVIDVISSILREYESIQEIVDSEVIDYTFHAAKERIIDPEICIERNWDPNKVEYEIAECLKKAFRVEQIRIRFDPVTKQSWPRFAFTIKGLIEREPKKYDEGKIVVHFAEDPVDKEQTIMVITILKPDY
jgi:hypothetical protein